MMKAFILAAGLGSRLKPYTDTTPKALMPVNGKPMIRHLMDRLINHGIIEFVVNVHHHAELLRKYLTDLQIPGIRLCISDESDALLDTGGALKRASGYFTDGNPFLIHNVDVWTDLNPNTLLKHHQLSGALATLAVRDRDTSRMLLFDTDLSLGGWENRNSGEQILCGRARESLTPYAFSGVQVVNPEIFRFFPQSDRFSLIDLYLKAASTEKIAGYRHDHDRWTDLGTIERINSLLQ